MQRSNVLFPEPEAPISVTAEPLGTSRSMPSRTRTPWNSLTTPRRTIVAHAIVVPDICRRSRASRWSVSRVSGIDTLRNRTAATT